MKNKRLVALVATNTKNKNTMIAIFDKKPSIYEANGNGSFTYRWDIKEVQISTGMDAEQNEQTTTKWECKEVIIWATVTANKITEAVICSLWSVGYEQKLINDYYAAKEGVFGSVTGVEAKKCIDNYKAFLASRKAVKEQINADCATLNIL